MTDTITIHEQAGFATSGIQVTSILASTFEISKKVDKTIIRLSQYLDGSFALTVNARVRNSPPRNLTESANCSARRPGT